MTQMKKIEDLRYEHNKMSQDELAERIGVTQATVSRWEADQTTITGKNLIKLSQLFKTPVDDLLGISKH